MPYQYVREPLTAEESDRLSKACETPTERLVVWTLLDTGLRVSELCDLTPKNVLWQQRQLRFKGKGGPHGKKTKVRVLPMSSRVRALLEHHFAMEKAFPVKTRRAQENVKAVANRAEITKDVSPHVLRHTFATMALQKGISLPTVQNPRTRQPPDDGDLPQFHRRAHPGRVRAEMVRTAHPRAIQQTGRLRTRFIGAGAFFCARWGARGAESLPRDARRRSSQATSRLDGITAHRCLWVRTGSGIRQARPHPRALPPPRTTWARSANRVYSVLQSKWPLRAPPAF